MFISEYIHNIQEGVRFCARYGIACSIDDEKLVALNPPVIPYLDKFKKMIKEAQKLEGFCTDHPNCFLSVNGKFIVTFSIYDGELTEKAQKKIRSKGYDLRESGFDMYGFGTKTYVMAELMSPLDEEFAAKKLPRIVPGEPEEAYGTTDASDDYHVIMTLKSDYILNEFYQILRKYGGDFISYRFASDAHLEIERLTDYIEIIQQRKPDEAASIIDEMVNTLQRIDTDDDTFPEYLIANLNSVIGNKND